MARESVAAPGAGPAVGGRDHVGVSPVGRVGVGRAGVSTVGVMAVGIVAGLVAVHAVGLVGRDDTSSARLAAERFGGASSARVAARPGDVPSTLPPVPVPRENPPSEAKRVLGKILFWDEQLSSDDTVACGTCHRPAAGGADPRHGRHPGTDPGTIDDVLGSPGIARMDRGGQRRPHPVFGDAPQVTRRLSPSNFGALWSSTQFWDGRATGRFRDPRSGAVVIEQGGALEAQALESLANDAEMAKSGREWSELTAKLARAEPLALASDLPPDVAAALGRTPSYPELFAAAFGDREITPVRIAFAIASYERTLVADQTPWDRHTAGDETALTQPERYGLEAMETFRCTNCHAPPLFTNNAFANIGLRRSEFDRGREAVTGDPEDAGEVKVPSLRNVGLRPRFMHTGELDTLGAAVSFYRTGPALPDRDDIPGAGIYAFNMNPLTEADIRSFLSRGLTDPRVRDELFPFDRPTLASERRAEAPARERRAEAPARGRQAEAPARERPREALAPARQRAD